MLTPRDIAKVEFKTAFRGYNEQQVDDFLKKVVTEYESIYRHNQELQRRLAEYEEKLAEARRTQDQVDELLEMARQTAEEARETARREADAILRESRATAAQEMEQVRAEYAEQAHKLRDLKHQETAIRRRVRGFLETLLYELDRHEEDDEESGDRLLAGLAEVAPGFEETSPERALGDTRVYADPSRDDDLADSFPQAAEEEASGSQTSPFSVKEGNGSRLSEGEARVIPGSPSRSRRPSLP